MAIFYRFSSPYVCVCVCLYTHTCGVFAYFWGMQDSAWYLASGSHLVILIEEMNEQSTDRGKPQWHGITWTGIWDRRSEKASQGMKMWMNLKVKESPTSWVGQERAFLAWGEMYVNKRAVLCLAAQLCPTLCDSIDCSPPGSSARGILQARILEWVASPFSRGSSDSGVEPGFLQTDSFPSEPPGKPCCH